MNDPNTYWLTVTNVALGIVTLICIVAVAIGVLQELAARRKQAAAMSHIDGEVAGLMASFQDGHVFPLPQLGVTMADGGEPAPPESQRDPKKEEK